MIILGVDPGIAIVGYGLIEDTSRKLRLIDCGCITTMAGCPQAERLADINKEILNIIEKFKPDFLAIEELFFCKNTKTALKVGEARGVILATAMQKHLIIREFTPLQIKQAITSYGRADKKQMQQMVKIILGLTDIIKSDDAADAVAAAITCAHSDPNKLK